MRFSCIDMILLFFYEILKFNKKKNVCIEGNVCIYMYICI